MKTVHVNASKEYDILIGKGLLPRTGKLVANVLKCKTLCLVSDDTVNALYADTVSASLEGAGYSVVRFVFPHGEQSKSAQTYLDLLAFLAENHLTRSDAIIALGGGVVGDLSGFAAATYQRGIRFVQIPTTLLAAVDSSVGGKTAIDIPAGKNLVGAFHQPELVICDTNTLRTLSEDIYRDGCAEIIKYGMICDEKLFAALGEKHVSEQEEDVICRCVEIKRDIVNRDEFDLGIRALLNFGHTVGHAIEACSNFGISHGTGVALGMRIVCNACAALGYCDAQCADALNAILDSYGFAKSVPYTEDELAAPALSDKKRSGNTITLILPEKVGRCVTHKITTDELTPFIKAGL